MFCSLDSEFVKLIPNARAVASNGTRRAQVKFAQFEAAPKGLNPLDDCD